MHRSNKKPFSQGQLEDGAGVSPQNVGTHPQDTRHHNPHYLHPKAHHHEDQSTSESQTAWASPVPLSVTNQNATQYLSSETSHRLPFQMVSETEMYK